MMRRLLFLLFFCLTSLKTGQTAPLDVTLDRHADLLPQLEKAGTQNVIRIIDGDTIILADRSRVRLVGIQAPELPLGNPARDLLSDLILGQDVTLYFGGLQRDRYGRLLAHLFRAADGLWIQGAMLEQGQAHVYSFPDNRAVVAQMLHYEKIARRNKAGIWALESYRPKNQATLTAHKNGFQVVFGTVRKVAKVRNRYYLNFGDDWRQDFTIMIRADAARQFIKAGIRPESFEGRTIETRGWIRSYNGPLIEVTHPEQIMIMQ